MTLVRFVRVLAALVIVVAFSVRVSAQTKEFVPEVGQPGKDVVWVPTPEEMVEKMLDLAHVTPQDYVMDLGSGDGRNVIAAAKRGARARGVEYNQDMVDLSKRRASEAGVADKAEFVQGDMFIADFSKANVLALFLLPSNLLQLRSKFLDLQPGSRIVANTFGIQDWTADESVTLENCTTWCTAMLYIVPAKVAGTWRLPQGELTVKQDYQMISGTLVAAGKPVEIKGKLRGDQVTFTAGDQEFTGRVDGNRISGTVRAEGRESNWSASKQS